MKTNHQSTLAGRNRWKIQRMDCLRHGILSFTVGSLITARLMHLSQVGADSNRVFELMIYHTVPGKAAALEAIFRDDSRIMAQHGINAVGFWVPNENPAWNDTFVYVVAFPSRDDAKKRWHELHADPASQPYVDAAMPLIEKAGEVYKVDEVYIRPADFSAMR